MERLRSCDNLHGGINPALQPSECLSLRSRELSARGIHSAERFCQQQTSAFIRVDWRTFAILFLRSILCAVLGGIKGIDGLACPPQG